MAAKYDKFELCQDQCQLYLVMLTQNKLLKKISPSSHVAAMGCLLKTTILSNNFSLKLLKTTKPQKGILKIKIF